MNWLVWVFQWTVCVTPAGGLGCFLCVSWTSWLGLFQWTGWMWVFEWTGCCQGVQWTVC